jgi:subtilase family serine protease
VIRVRRRLIALLLPALVAATALSAQAAPARVRLGGAVPAWATTVARVGDARDGDVAQIQVVLPWRDPAAARRLAYDVSDPASQSYGQHLTPAQWRARFAPTTATVSAITTWLRAQELEVGTIPQNRVVIPARGTVGQLERAFGISLGEYAVAGQVLRAPDLAPTLPAAIARLVSGVRGLDQGAALIHAGDDTPPPPLPQEPPTPLDVGPPAAVVYGKPCSAYHASTIRRDLPSYGRRKQPAVTCATSPQAVQSAYGVSPLLRKKVDGRGETVVMVGSHAIKPLASDVNTWSKRHRLPALRANQLRQVSYPGAYQTPVAEPVLRPEVWAVQAATLFETAHTAAPGADLLYVGTTSSFDLATGTMLAVDGAWGDVVINGWYTTSEDVPDAEWQLIDRIGEQAAATGISLLFAAGDLGDGTYAGAERGKTVYPASEPLATSVGATSLIVGKGGRYVRELAWGKAQYVLEGRSWSEDLPATYRATGGGVSDRHPQPAYQKGVVPKSVAARPTGAAGRAVPDLAVMGDAETGMAIGYTQHFPDGTDRYSERRVASSTASTALVAGLLALANDKLNRNVGFANPLLYSTWRAHRSAYRDIVRYGRAGAGIRVDYKDGATAKSGSKPVLKVFEEMGENHARRGYDTASGLGSPSPVLLQLLK